MEQFAKSGAPDIGPTAHAESPAPARARASRRAPQRGVRRRRAAWVAALALLCAVALSACGGSNKSATTSATLTVWDPVTAGSGATPDYVNRWLALIDQVNARFRAANPGVKIVEKHFNYADFTTKVPAAVAANNAPDVLYYTPDNVWKYTLPLDDLLTQWQKENVTLLGQSIINAKDDRLHQMPFGVVEQGTWMYNRALFRRAGITAPPTTQAQFLAVCDKLNAAGIVPIRQTFGGPYTMDRYVALLGAQLIPDIKAWNQQEMSYRSPALRTAVEAFMAMTAHRCWGPNPQSTAPAGEGDQWFRSGRTAIQYIGTPPDIADYEKAIGKGNLDVFRQPALPGGEPFLDMGQSWAFQIVKTTKHRDLAWRYISFWLEPQQQKLAWTQIQQLPNLRSSGLQSDVPIYSKMLAWARNPAYHLGPWPATPQEFRVWDDLTPQVVTGQISVDELLSRLQAAREASKG